MKLLDDASHINHPCVQICHWRALMISFILWLLQMTITLPNPIWHQLPHFALTPLTDSAL